MDLVLTLNMFIDKWLLVWLKVYHGWSLGGLILMYDDSCMGFGFGCELRIFGDGDKWNIHHQIFINGMFWNRLILNHWRWICHFVGVSDCRTMYQFHLMWLIYPKKSFEFVTLAFQTGITWSILTIHHSSHPLSLSIHRKISRYRKEDRILKSILLPRILLHLLLLPLHPRRSQTHHRPRIIPLPSLHVLQSNRFSRWNR